MVLPQLGENALQLIFGEREVHRDGAELVDDQSLRRIRGDQVTRVNLAQTHLAVDRRLDVAVDDIELGGLDRCLIGFDGAHKLPQVGLHGVGLFLGDDSLIVERLVTVELRLVVLQLGLVARKLALRLIERRLIGPRIDGHQLGALADVLALAEVDVGQLSRYPRNDGDAVIGHDGAQTGEIDGNRLLPHGCDLHRDRLVGHRVLLSRGDCGCFPLCRDRAPGDQSGEGKDHQQHHPAQPAAFARLLRVFAGRFTTGNAVGVSRSRNLFGRRGR